jgi:hypothetical protein
MGMFDTIILDKEYACPKCQERIDSVQVKALENVLENYHVKDCVSHAEDIRIVKDELFCDNCREFIGIYIYIVINRGILVGTRENLENAKNLLNDFNMEKLILWYHDLYQRYMEEKGERDSYKKFLGDLCEWYGERLYEKPEDAALKLIWNLRHFKGALNPVESIERFMTYKKLMRVLDELWEVGHEILDIYYPEEIDAGKTEWSVDVYQDEINERCQLNWTWTVMSKEQLDMDGDKEDELPDWALVVEEPFSDQVVCSAIERWLQQKSYKFAVRMVSIGETKGSGLVKKLKQMDIEAEKRDALPMEEAVKKITDKENEKLASVIQREKEKKKLLYYEGFYGSLVPDVDFERLIGKIEGIKESIIYEGKTVKECDQKFREAVLRYKKGETIQRI